jgi:hypothetical protein
MGRPRIHGKPTLTIGVSEEIADRLEALKAEEEDKLGFKMSYSQFVSMLVKHFEERKRHTFVTTKENT